MQDNLEYKNKANEGTGIRADSDSLAFCVSDKPIRPRRPTHTQIQQARNKKIAYRHKLWSALIGYDNEVFEWRCC